MLWVQMSSWLFWTTFSTLPQRDNGLEKNPNCIVFVTLDYGVEPPLPIAQMGLLRPPGEGGAAGGCESEGELGSSPALPAVTGTNSLHFLLTTGASGSVGIGQVGTTERTPPVPAGQPHSLPHSPLPMPAKSPKSRRPVAELGFCVRYMYSCHLRAPQGSPSPRILNVPQRQKRLERDHSPSLQQ